MGTVQKFKFMFSCGILEVFFVISDSFLILKYDAVHYFWDFKIWVKSVKLPKNIFTFQVSFILSFLSMFSIGSSKKCQSKLTLKATESVRMAQKNCQHYLFYIKEIIDLKTGECYLKTIGFLINNLHVFGNILHHILFMFLLF